MSISWKAATAGSALSVALIAGAAVSIEGFRSESSPSSDSTPLPTGIVTIDPEQGETFTPSAVPAGGRFMTADDAWAKWENGLRLSDTPAVKAQFGSLVLLTGPQGAPGTEVQQDGVPVWAFEEPGCRGTSGTSPDPTGPASSSTSTSEGGDGDSVSSSPCATWTFIDAMSGEEVDSTGVPSS